MLNVLQRVCLDHLALSPCGLYLSAFSVNCPGSVCLGVPCSIPVQFLASEQLLGHCTINAGLKCHLPRPCLPMGFLTLAFSVTCHTLLSWNDLQPSVSFTVLRRMSAEPMLSYLEILFFAPCHCYFPSLLHWFPLNKYLPWKHFFESSLKPCKVGIVVFLL